MLFEYIVHLIAYSKVVLTFGCTTNTRGCKPRLPHTFFEIATKGYLVFCYQMGTENLYCSKRPRSDSFIQQWRPLQVY